MFATVFYFTFALKFVFLLFFLNSTLTWVKENVEMRQNASQSSGGEGRLEHKTWTAGDTFYDNLLLQQVIFRLDT